MIYSIDILSLYALSINWVLCKSWQCIDMVLVAIMMHDAPQRQFLSITDFLINLAAVKPKERYGCEWKGYYLLVL